MEKIYLTLIFMFLAICLIALVNAFVIPDNIIVSEYTTLNPVDDAIGMRDTTVVPGYSFTANDTGTLFATSVWLKKDTPISNVTLIFYEQSGNLGTPDEDYNETNGVILGTFDPTSLTTSFVQTNITFNKNNVSILEGHNYTVAFNGSGSDYEVYLKRNTDLGSPTSNGVLWVSGSWSVKTYDINHIAYINSSAAPPEDDCLYTGGNWEINENCTFINNNTINIDGNLTLEALGTLNLYNTSLNFNSSGQYMIFDTATSIDKLILDGTSRIN